MTETLSQKDYRALPANDRRQKKKRNNEEHQHQAAFFAILKANENRYPFLAFVFAVPNGGKRDPRTAAMLQSEGVKPGCPDLCIPIARKGCHGAFLEMKSSAGKMSEAQIKFRDFLIKGGYFVKACYSVDEAIRTVEWYLGVELSK